MAFDSLLVHRQIRQSEEVATETDGQWTGRALELAGSLNPIINQIKSPAKAGLFIWWESSPSQGGSGRVR